MKEPSSKVRYFSRILEVFGIVKTAWSIRHVKTHMFPILGTNLCSNFTSSLILLMNCMIMLIFPALVETLDFLVTEQRKCVEWCLTIVFLLIIFCFIYTSRKTISSRKEITILLKNKLSHNYEKYFLRCIS